MARNGTGTFIINSAGQPVSAGQTISSSVFNALTSDLANGLTTSICTDGQTTTTGLIPFAMGLSTNTLSAYTPTGAVTLTYGQLAFPATQNPSTNANTLDDYEEGTWTPSDASGAGLSFSSVNGRYTKIGSLVFASGQVTYPATADATNAAIGGLPFTASNAIAANLDGGYIVTTNSVRQDLFQVNRNTTTFLIRTVANNGVPNSAYSGSILGFTIIYTATT